MDKSTFGSNLNIKCWFPSEVGYSYEFLSRLWIFIVPFLFWNTCVLETQSHPGFPGVYFLPFSSPFSLFPALLSSRYPGSMGCGLHRRELEDELAPTLQHHLPFPGAGLVEQALNYTTHASFDNLTCGEDKTWKTTGQRTYIAGWNINE